MVNSGDVVFDLLLQTTATTSTLGPGVESDNGGAGSRRAIGAPDSAAHAGACGCLRAGTAIDESRAPVRSYYWTAGRCGTAPASAIARPGRCGQREQPLGRPLPRCRCGTASKSAIARPRRCGPATSGRPLPRCRRRVLLTSDVDDELTSACSARVWEASVSTSQHRPSICITSAAPVCAFVS